ncbi:hypothetical protein EL18_02839 [Nitratireductor basaltis]|uniref:TPM domain-containing protein n=2 Tax=Nitratireductor basaltis TaxID=472175 RepID=A0A084U6K0_9HYPH|nr:hypothetical protein EL18_02839 [Nitratireductor basaltis]
MQASCEQSGGSLTHALRLVVLALLVSCITSIVAMAQGLPALTGRVVDNAGLLDAASETRLTARLAAFEERASDQIVIATLPSLNGEAIEPFANRLFRSWGLGHTGEDNGVLLLVVPNDRKMRIEVGYGLEGTLTDLHSKLIIENTMVPAFRNGDFAAGIEKAVEDIIMVLEGNGAELEARARRVVEEQQDPIWPLALFLVVWGTLFFGGLGLALLAPIFGRKIGPGRYEWLGMEIDTNPKKPRRKGSWSRGGYSGGGGWSGGGGFSGGGGSSGGGGASGSW